jgi:hypothetical protein
MPGEITHKVAVELAKENPKYQIIVSHGPSKIINLRNFEKKKVQLSLNDKKSNKTIISNADIAIIQNNNAVAIIEIEEKGTIAPKKLFSNLISFIFTKKVFIKNLDVNINSNVIFAIIGKHNPDGSTQDKITNINESMKSFIGTNGISISNDKIKIKTFKEMKVDQIKNWIYEIIEQ